MILPPNCLLYPQNIRGVPQPERPRRRRVRRQRKRRRASHRRAEPPHPRRGVLQSPVRPHLPAAFLMRDLEHELARRRVDGAAQRERPRRVCPAAGDDADGARGEPLASSRVRVRVRVQFGVLQVHHLPVRVHEVAAREVLVEGVRPGRERARFRRVDPARLADDHLRRRDEIAADADARAAAAIDRLQPALERRLHAQEYPRRLRSNAHARGRQQRHEERQQRAADALGDALHHRRPRRPAWGLSVAVEHVGERATRLFHEVGALVPVDQRAQALHAVARDELRFPSPDVAHAVRAHRGVSHREEELVSMPPAADVRGMPARLEPSQRLHRLLPSEMPVAIHRAPPAAAPRAAVPRARVAVAPPPREVVEDLVLEVLDHAEARLDARDVGGRRVVDAPLGAAQALPAVLERAADEEGLGASSRRRGGRGRRRGRRRVLAAAASVVG
mmetsp:Transcript_5808/g.21159  ORF Transcript_5808/g.21159 Transcript_5808/m.21159 type:complete len:447 (-) Transcript_5808:422-1762(-)